MNRAFAFLIVVALIQTPKTGVADMPDVLAGRVVTDLSGPGWTLTETDGTSYVVTVPHSWNTVDGCDGRGVLSSERYAKNSSCMNSYERKRVVYSRALPAPKAGRRYFVRCEGASITASVCVNGRKIGEHLGALTAFCCAAKAELAALRREIGKTGLLSHGYV